MNFADTQISRVKEYWDRRPCNIRHSPEPVGTRQYFDEPHIPGFAQFDRWRGKKVLEIGCGIGTDTINFVRSGAQVSAVDLSEKSMELARARASVFGLQHHILFYSSNAEELTRFVPVEPYDLIYS